MYGVKELVLCVIYPKCVEVPYVSVVLRYMGDENEESYECLFILAERRCKFFYIVYELY
jgi:hypothetical protein